MKYPIVRSIIGLSALALIFPLPGQAKSLEELLAEKGLLTKAEASSVNRSPAGDPARVYYDGGTRIEFADAGVNTKVNVFLQNRYDYSHSPKGKPNVSSFSINKARLVVSGNALHNEFGYELESDLVGTTQDGEKVGSVKNAYVSWTPCDYTTMRLGQFKPAISRQFNTSDQNLEFVDRSATSNYFGIDREPGASAKLTLDDYHLIFGAAIFNGESKGEGISRSGVDTNHTGVVSARWNPIGKMNAFSEGDVDWTEDAAVSVGGAYAYSGAHQDLGAGLERANANRVSADVNFRMQGINVQGEYFIEKQSNDVSVEAQPQGFYLQAGYFVDPKTVELAARYGLIDCDSGNAPGICIGNDKINTAEAGINYHWWKHNLKAQLGYAFQNQNPVASGISNVNSSKWTLELTAYL